MCGICGNVAFSSLTVFLKRYARRYLPDDIVNRRKRGLSVPIGSWLRGPLKEWAATTLEKGRLEQVGIHTSPAMEFFSEHCQRKADHARTLWTLLVLGEWLDWVATEADCGETDQGHKGVFADPPHKLTGKVPFRARLWSRSPAASADQSFRRK